jgi:protein-disulfide isomerase
MDCQYCRRTAYNGSSSDNIFKEKKMLRKINMLTFILFGSLHLSSPVIAMAQVVYPVTHQPYTVSLAPSEDKAYVGEPYFIHLNLFPKTLPPGYTVSTLVDLLESPAGAKPEILTGFPAIQLKMMQPGAYKMAIRLSLITKSSCAGVDAKGIFEKTLTLEVNER